MKTKDLAQTALLVSLLSASAYISIPIFMISFSLQTFIIMIIGLNMPHRIAVLSVTVYLFLGGIGLPIFASGQAGLSTLMGPTGGYLFGFLVAVYFMSITQANSFKYKFLSALVFGVAVVYVFGIMGLMLVLKIGINEALIIGVIPFILSDLLKALLAVWISIRYQSWFRHFKS